MSNVCYVDEVITNKKDVTYVAFSTKVVNDQFKTYKNIKKAYFSNLDKINNDHVREVARKEIKSNYLRMMGFTTKTLKPLIDHMEVDSIKRYKCSESKIEIENRLKALKKLITKTDCKLIFIDDYSNKQFKDEISSFASSQKKKTVFVDSMSSQGIMLADVFLDLY